MIARMCPDGDAFIVVLEKDGDYLGEFVVSRIEKDKERVYLYSEETMIGIIRPKSIITDGIIWEGSRFAIETAVAFEEEVPPGFTAEEYHDLCEREVDSDE